MNIYTYIYNIYIYIYIYWLQPINTHTTCQESLFEFLFELSYEVSLFEL